MSKHTPGPWAPLEVHRGEYQVSANGQTAGYEGETVAVCRIIVTNWDGEPPHEQIAANARLIAAAPDLLAALRSTLGYIHDPNGVIGRQVAAALEKAEPS